MLKGTINDCKIFYYLQMQRIKCSEIIKNILGLYFNSNLMEDIGVGNNSLFLHESNDITMNKMLGIAISEKLLRFFLIL